MGITSKFDLSPLEKLQMVEDLWDDPAASPSDVPLYNWQKKELEKKKLRLMRNPESGISWNEIQQRARWAGP